MFQIEKFEVDLDLCVSAMIKKMPHKLRQNKYWKPTAHGHKNFWFGPLDST